VDFFVDFLSPLPSMGRREAISRRPRSGDAGFSLLFCAGYQVTFKDPGSAPLQAAKSCRLNSFHS
jgi:hypothetical protein